MLIPRQRTPDLNLPTLGHGQFDLSTEASERGTVICIYDVDGVRSQFMRDSLNSS